MLSNVHNRNANTLGCDRKVKISRSDESYLAWKLWLLRNYEFCPDACISISSVCKFASCSEDKENSPVNPLTVDVLGYLVKDLWKGNVKRVKRGPRGKQESHYLNMNKKIVESCSSTSMASGYPTTSVDVLSLVHQLKVPNDWTIMFDNEKKASFIRLEQVEINNHRATTEVSVEAQPEGVFKYTVQANGNKCNLDEINIIKLICGSGLVKQITEILNLVDRSKICEGYQLLQDQNVVALLPHKTVSYRNHGAKGNLEKIAFSESCSGLLIRGETGHNVNRCASCSNLMTMDKQRLKRKRSRSDSGQVKSKCNKRYMARDELEQQLTNSQLEKKYAKEREQYWKEKFTRNAIEVEEEDHEDLTKNFQGVDQKSIPTEMRVLWQQQHKIIATASPNGYRWHPKIMKLCLDLYCKNPHVLEPLREFIKLPSNRTIRLYKNKIGQSPGWNDEIITWCLDEARRQVLKPQDYYGGFVIDEMKIQENLEMVVKNGKHKLVGFVDLGKTHDVMTHLSGKTEPELATQVLQFIFLSDCGFRFPIAQFPSGSSTPSDLYFLFWEGVLKMLEEGFMIYWCILDGAACNRQFIKIHFGDTDPVEQNFMTPNMYTNEPMIFIMDPKHNIKKIRNNVSKSNITTKPRCLQINGKDIMWKQFKDAYHWDQSSFSLPLHERLTEHHFDLDSASKMRNHLAEDVLDIKMLFLMQKYQEGIACKSGNDASATLDATVSLLKHTSKIVEMFNDKLPISSVSDKRLENLSTFYDFMLKWREETIDANNHFVSSQLWFDLQSMCIGFTSMVIFKLKKFPQSVVKPAIINQDCVENHFCQIRACNGQNNNPTFHQQEATQNSIRFGQTTVSRKSNAGKPTPKEKLSTCSLSV